LTGPDPSWVRPCRVRAFGLALDAPCPLIGAGEDTTARPRRRVRLSLVEPEVLRRSWRPTAPRRLSTRRRPTGRVAFSVDEDPQAGHLLRCEPFGSFLIHAGAASIACAPRPRTLWRWQRFLTGQVLPFAALLRGLEVLHASAVAVSGAAHAFIGASQAGKTTLAAHLVSHGARLVTDDVLALEAADGAVMAHPGVGLMNLRHDTVATLPPERLERLGTEVGRDRNAVRIAMARQEGPVPLRRVYLLDRRDDGAALQIEPLARVDPFLLLSATFNFVVDSPQRLRNHLEVCARIAQCVAVYRLGIPPSATPAQVAEHLLGDLPAVAA
jgi:hypothetical protein